MEAAGDAEVRERLMHFFRRFCYLSLTFRSLLFFFVFTRTLRPSSYIMRTAPHPRGKGCIGGAVFPLARVVRNDLRFRRSQAEHTFTASA